MSCRIDSHQHFWRLDRGDYYWLAEDQAAIYRDFGPEELEPILKETGIAGTVLVQAADTVAETRFLLDLARRNPFVAGVVGWIDMTDPDAAERLAALAADPYLRGIRPMLRDVSDPAWILDESMTPVFEWLQRHGLTFDALVEPRHLRSIYELLRRHPDLDLVVDHAARPPLDGTGFKRWADAMAALADRTQAYCKLSGLVSRAGTGWSAEQLRPCVEHLLACFGPERLMWGSDWPMVELAGGYLQWWRATQELLAPVRSEDREAILGATAARFYGLVTEAETEEAEAALLG